MGAAIDIAATYTEADPNTRLTQSTVTATFTGVKRDENAYLYKDWGAGFFGDFVHDFETTGTTWANGSKLVVWGVSDTIAAMSGWAAGLYLILNATSTTAGTYTLGEVGGAAGTSVGASIAKTIMYWRIERNGTTLTAKRATSAANRTAGTFAETLTISCATTTYQYQFAGSTFNDANTTAVTQTTANFKGTKMTSAGTPFDSAFMVGASSGDWDAGATWGNTGSVKGTDYPGTAADVFNIDVGDIVTYNVAETNALGSSSVYGTLTFKKDSNTKIQFGNAILTIKNGGALRIGTSANPIDSSHTAEMYFTGGSDNGYGLSTDTTGALEIEGTDINGDTMFSYLVSDWSGGQTFTVHGDVTGKWVNGQKIITHRFPAAYTGAVNSYEYTIASMAANGGNTDITISEAAPGGTFRAGALVANTTRNVMFGKTSATQTPGTVNGTAPYIICQSTLSSVKHAAIIGAWAFSNTSVTGKLDLTNVVVRNSSRLGSYSAYSYNVTADKLLVISCNISTQIGGEFSNVVSFCYGGQLFSSNFCCSFTTVYVANGTNNSYPFIGDLNSGCLFKDVDVVDYAAYIGGAGAITLGSDNKFFNINFGKYRHHANVCTNITFIHTINGLVNMYFYNAYLNGTLAVSTWAAAGQGDLRFDDYGGTLGDTRRSTKDYDAISQATVVRNGGAAIALAISRMDASTKRSLVMPLFEWVEWDVVASAQTRQIYIRGGNGGAEDWSTYPTAAELFLEAEYYDEAGTPHKAFVVSTAVLTDNTTWTAFPVTFTPGRVGQVVYRLRLGLVTGVASKKLYVDPQLNS